MHCASGFLRLIRFIRCKWCKSKYHQRVVKSSFASILHHGLSRCSFSLGAAGQLKPEFIEQSTDVFWNPTSEFISTRTYMTWCSLPNMGWKRLQSFQFKALEDCATFGMYSEFQDSQLGWMFQRIYWVSVGSDTWMWTSRWTQEQLYHIVLKCHTHTHKKCEINACWWVILGLYSYAALYEPLENLAWSTSSLLKCGTLFWDLLSGL